jgi:hypothetical protein
MKMKHKLVMLLIFVILSSTVMSNIVAQEQGLLPYTCEDGTIFENAVATTINLRAGQYTVAVLGVDGFDPQIAVVDFDNKELACVQDSPEAADYTVNLVTSGKIDASNKNAQAIFNVGENFTDVSVIVSDQANSNGELVLLFGTLRATSSDVTGDPIVVALDEPVLKADIPISAYMVSLQGSLDALIEVATKNNKPVSLDGARIYCDDWDTIACFGRENILSEEGEYSISAFVDTQLYSVDAVLTLDDVTLERVKTARGNLVFLMTRFGDVEGEYMVALHMGVGKA